MSRVVFIDDDAIMRTAAEQWFGLADMQVETHADPLAGLQVIEAEGLDFDGVVITDVRMPKCDGLDVLTRTIQADPTIPVILVTGHGDVPMAVEAMRRGAYDFMEKPFDPERVLEAVRRAASQRALMLENRALRRNLAGRDAVESRLVGHTESIKAVRRQISDVASTAMPVLISGETGTGKEVVARLLHDLSPRAHNRFVALDCAAVHQDSFESDIFGHARGAYAGATQARQGRLRSADGGTLFLDQIDALPTPLQAKLLRVLETGDVEPLGDDMVHNVDVRAIATTSLDVDAAVSEGRLRADLLHRLAAFHIVMPPLRERRDDVALLFAHFVATTRHQHDTVSRELDTADLDALARHDFQGNVRELRNIAERFVVNDGAPIASLLGPADTAPQDHDAPDYRSRLARFERHLITDAIARHGASMTAVMEELELPRRTLNEKMRRLGIRRPN